MNPAIADGAALSRSNAYRSCCGQDPTLKGPCCNMTQNGWVHFQQHATQIGHALSWTQRYLGHANQDSTMMGLDAAGPKGILGLAGGSSGSSFHQDPMALGPVGPIRVGSYA